MSQKYIILCLIFELLVEINCQMKMQRSSHTATFINNKLYIWGGYNFGASIVLKDFFYIDVSVPFNTQNLSWQSSINTVLALSGAASVKGGADNNTLFLYGGEPDDVTTAVVIASSQLRGGSHAVNLNGAFELNKRTIHKLLSDKIRNPFTFI